MPSNKSILLWMLFFVTLAIGLAIGLGVVAGDIEKYFGEGEPITWLSFLQLLVVSGLSWKVFRSYNTISDLRPWRSPHILWLIIAIGFLFLAFDEVAKIHEGMDKRIHRIFDIQETGLTDRLDDVIVMFYGLIGIMTLLYYKEEFKKYASTFPFFIIGFILLFTMVGLDILTNRNDILLFVTGNSSITKTLVLWLAIAEESFKLLAECMFIVGFYGCFKIAKGKKTA